MKKSSFETFACDLCPNEYSVESGKCGSTADLVEGGHIHRIDICSKCSEKLLKVVNIELTRKKNPLLKQEVVSFGVGVL